MTTLITDKKALNEAIEAWGVTGKEWTKKGHILAMSALSMLAAHGDIGPVNRLYLAMPKGTKTTAMAEWLLTFGKLVPTEDKEKAKSQPFTYSKEKANNLEGAAKKPWFEFKPEPTVLETFDVQAAVKAAIKAIEQKAAKAQSVSGSTALESLKALAEGFEENTEELAGIATGNE